MSIHMLGTMRTPFNLPCSAHCGNPFFSKENLLKLIWSKAFGSKMKYPVWAMFEGESAMLGFSTNLDIFCPSNTTMPNFDTSLLGTSKSDNDPVLFKSWADIRLFKSTQVTISP